MHEPPEEQVLAGIIARGAIKLARTLCRQSIHGLELDKDIETYILDHGGRPALKGYHPSFADKPYEWTICLAIDNEAVHGVPHKQVNPEDLITVDLVVKYQNWHADTARTFTYGDQAKQKFVQDSETIFAAGLDMIIPERSINSYADMVLNATRLCGYGIVGEYCGHGIGREIHMSPQIVNYPTPSNEFFKMGRAYAVEPVLAMDPAYRLTHDDDGFTVRGNCLISHQEDTVFISKGQVINLTR